MPKVANEDVLLGVIRRAAEANGAVRFTQAWALYALEIGRAVEADTFSVIVEKLVRSGALVERPGVPESRLTLPPPPAILASPVKQKIKSRLTEVQKLSADASEKELMPALGNWIAEVHAPRFFPTAKRNPDFRLVDTSTGGARSGTWSQPDFTGALLRNYEYSTLRHIELVGYELKRAGQGKVTAVHEALVSRLRNY